MNEEAPAQIKGMDELLYRQRHSAAHIMAEAVLTIFPEAKYATAINFLEYERRGPDLDVMLVTGRFGLKSYSLDNPAKPKLLDDNCPRP